MRVNGHDRTAEPDRAMSALLATPCPADRDAWWRLVASAKAAGLDEDVIRTWSANGPNFNDRDFGDTYRSLDAAGGYTGRTLFQAARAAGWRDDQRRAATADLHTAAAAVKQAASAPDEAQTSIDIANRAWSRYAPATAAQPYIKSKLGQPDGLRVTGDGALAVPLFTLDGELIAVQTIGTAKRFLKDTRPGQDPAACYVVGGPPPGAGVIYITEGIGQGWSAHQATRKPAAVAFGVGRMAGVARGLRARSPNLCIVIVADAGQELICARIAAEVGGSWVEMPAGSPKNFDVNDLHQRDGLQAVADLLASPKHPKVLRVSTPLNWTSLASRKPPQREWAIDGWLGMGHTTLLGGLGGIGKTLTAQTVGSALSIGRDYIANVPKPRKVMLWGCEDDHDEFWRRQLDIAEYLGVPLEAFAENLVIVPRVGLDNTLLGKGFDLPTWTPVMGELIEQVNDLSVDVLIVDNVGQTCANEIDRHMVTTFVNAFSGIRPGLATLLLAHPAKAAGSEFSGSTAWENAVRMRWYLGTKLPDQVGADPEDEVDEAGRFLCKRKTNYSAKDYVRLTYQDGVLVPDDAPLNFDARFRADIAERIVLSSITKLAAMGKYPTDGTTSPDYLPKLIVDFKLHENMTKRDLANAMRSLMVSGKLKRRVVGKYSNRSDRFGLVPC